MQCHYWSLFLPITIMFGCTSKSDGTENVEPDTPAETTEYYDVHSEGLWQNSYEFESHLVASRTLQPSTSTISEQFIGISETEMYEATMNIDLETSTFTLFLDYEDGSYEGEGVLYGDAWDWHAWESTSVASDGSSVVSTDTRDEDGIVAEKVGYDATGQEEWTMVETLTPITEEEWLALQEDSE